MVFSEEESLLFSTTITYFCFSSADVRKVQQQAGSTPIRLRPIVVAKFYPEYQPGYGHDESLGAEDSYAFVPTSDRLVDSPATFPATPHQQLPLSHPYAKKSINGLKKLLTKPKKMMKVSFF